MVNNSEGFEPKSNSTPKWWPINNKTFIKYIIP